MPKYFHHFLPILSLSSQEELEKIRCLQEIPIIIKSDNAIVVRLLGRPQSIDVIAITIPNHITDQPDQRQYWIEQIGNHMISTLRLTYDTLFDVIRNGDGFINYCNETDDPQPSYKLLIQRVINEQHIINFQDIAGFFCETYNLEVRPVLSLLAEAQTPSIPIHYQVLSLTRALEILLPDESERFQWLDRYQNQFEKIKISGRLFKNALHDLRARCAHGVPNGSPAPFVSQAYRELKEMPQLLVLLRIVVTDYLTEKHGLKLFAPVLSPVS